MCEETGQTGRSERFWRRVERAKDVLEILAILIAGAWAITLFWYYDAPSNVRRIDLQGDLAWSKYSKDVCEALYTVEFKNIGRVSVEVGRVRLSTFAMPDVSGLPPGQSMKLLDPEKLVSGTPLMQEETTRLNGDYPPDERDVEGFSFIVKRSRGSLMLFRAEVWDEAASKDPNARPTWHDFRWDWVCGENPEMPEAPEGSNTLTRRVSHSR